MDWMRLFSVTGVSLIGAVFGTVVQARLALQALQSQEPLARSAITIYDLKREVGWWHPVRRWKHRRIVSRALQESPAEAEAYRRVSWVLVSWSALATGSVMGLIGHAMGR